MTDPVHAPAAAKPGQPGPCPRVVIVGAGFAGMAAAKALAAAPVELTIIDRQNFHLFQPLLYQVATAALSPADIAWPVRSVFASQKNATVLMMDICAIDMDAKCVRDAVMSLPFDYLVIATGATHAYFGHDDWATYACGLKTIEDARGLRDKLLSALETAEKSESASERQRHMTSVVVGGGATGVEMAGAIAELSHHTLKGEFRRVDPRGMKVVLVEAGPRILPTFPPKLSAQCEVSLRKMGVDVRTNTRVTGCNALGVLLEGEQIAAASVIWAAGVRASNAAQWLNAIHDPSNRILVNADLSVPGHPNIFAIGDTCSIVCANRSVPGVAPAAKQMGNYVGMRIAVKVRGLPALPPFVYRHAGDLAVIGRSSAVVAIGPLKLWGPLAWSFWSVVHIFFLIGFRSKIVVAINWIWSFVTRKRGARLIAAPSSGVGSPRGADRMTQFVRSISNPSAPADR
jgi:NADH dehydrogenase